MATPKTIRTYTLNGSLKDFTIPFEYLARKFVAVTLIGATRQDLVLNTDFRFSTPTTITTTLAWGPGQNFDLIEIRRNTSASDRLVDFADGSILRAFDLNTSQVQSLHIAEEARDLTADTIGVNNEGQLDARAKRIVNLADPVNPGDAVNLRMNQQWAGSALNQATLSAQSAAASESSRQAAGVQATNSANSATASQASRVAAEQALATTITHKNTAGTSATNSEASNVRSQEWASKTEDVAVTPGLFSSWHYSRKSAASATASANSATQAAQKVVDAQSQVSLAATEANRATTEADRAAAEADALGNMNGLAENMDDSTTGAGNWSVTFKGILKAIGKVLGVSFESSPYTASKAFAQQHVTDAPFFVKAQVLNTASEYVPILKANLKVAGADESLSLGTLSYIDGTHAAVLHWGGTGGVGGPLMTLKRNGTQVAFSGAIESPGTINGTGGCFNNGYKTWSRADFDPNTKLSNTGTITSNGGYTGIAGGAYINYSAGNQVYLGGIEIRENGLVGAGGPAPLHPYNAPGFAFHWGSVVVQRLFMNAAGQLCFGNPAGAYVIIATDGNINGSVYGGWITNYIYNVSNDRAYAWAGDTGRIGAAAAQFRINSMGATVMGLAHNNSGTEWNEGVAGSNVTGTCASGVYWAGYTMAGSYVRMGKLINADGASADSVTCYHRYA
jgi:hypothetical protein